MRLAALMTILATAALSPLAAGAQPAPPACAAKDAALPSEIAAWTAKAPLIAASRAGGLSKAALTPGRTALAELPLTADVAYVSAPEKAPAAATHGGLLDLKIGTAGTYLVALGAGTWLDVVRDGKPVASSAHSHGPDCSTVHKIVDFKLTPGRYVLQLSGSPDGKVAVLVAKRP